MSEKKVLYPINLFPECSTELTPKSQAEVLSKGTDRATPAVFDGAKRLWPRALMAQSACSDRYACFLTPHLPKSLG